MDVSKMKFAEDLMNFTPPTDRVLRLKELALNTKAEICVERARIITEADAKYGAMPPPLKWSYMLDEILSKISIYIGEDELIVGNMARKINAAPLFPEYSSQWIIDEIDDLPTRPGDRFIVRPEEREEILEIARYWAGRCHQSAIEPLLTENYKLAEQMGILEGIHIRTPHHGHIAANYAKIMQIGLKGIIEEAEKQLVKLDRTKADDVDKLPFLTGVPIVCKAAIKFANRYADLAEKMAAAEKNETRKNELLVIAKNCRRVPENPPDSFYEAVQMTFFIELMLQIEANGHSYSMGRFDQYTNPFYEADVEKAALTARGAQEILACFFVKLKMNNKVRPWDFAKYATGYPLYQNITISGQSPEGEDASNAVSYLCLNAMENVRFPEPNLITRIWSGTPDEYMRKCVDTFSLGFGMPAFINDDIITEALMEKGVTREDAFNYNAIGCIEVSVAGKWGHRPSGMTMNNFARQFEMTLRGGTLPGFDKTFISGAKSLAECTTFDEFLEQWKHMNEVCVRMAVEHDILVDELKRAFPTPLLSALVDDCIKRGKTILEGGAVYDLNGTTNLGLTCMGNSMAAVKRLIYDEKRFTAEELMKALDENFEGENGEVMRQICENSVPKFGNDDDFVDDIAVKAYEIYMDVLEPYRNARYGRGPIGCQIYPCTVTISSNVPAGHATGATPDGRKAGVPVAEGCSPHSGSDKKGPSAVLKSVSKYPTHRVTGGQLLNIKFAPTMLEKPGNREKVVSLIRTFTALRDWHIQFNVISAETLRAAQAEPEKHRNLMVRVAGYCALFTDLDADVQNEIIIRTEHTAM
jgi:formate C-acetyltransferase